MNGVRAWFLSLAPRERALVAGGAAVLLVLIVYLLVVEPLVQRRALLERGVASQRELLTWMQQAVVPLRNGAGQRVQSRGESLFAVVDRSARGSALAGALQRVQPEGNTNVRVWFNDAAFDELVRWLAALQREHGVAVGGLTVERADCAGLVNARVTLERSP